jgi:glycosyltransferase involved in cell wall biosynthesis
MISVVIPTLDDGERLALTLAALVPAAADGVVRDVVVVDGGSVDETLRIADAAGCIILRDDGPIGSRLARGAAGATRGEFLMVLRPGVLLDPGWSAEVRHFAERVARSGRADRAAAVFRFELDDIAGNARLRKAATALASRLSGLPHPAQPLVISRRLYQRLGGHRPLAALEDIDLVRRIGRRRIARLRSAAAVLAPAAGAPAMSLRQRLTRALGALPLSADLLARLHG